MEREATCSVRRHIASVCEATVAKAIAVEGEVPVLEVSYVLEMNAEVEDHVCLRLSLR